MPGPHATIGGLTLLAAVATLAVLAAVAALAAGCGRVASPCRPARRRRRPPRRRRCPPRPRADDASAAPRAVTQTAIAPPSGTLTSSAGSFTVEYTLEPDPVPLNELFGIRVRIADADDPGKPLGNIDLVVDGRMPEHRHGMNREPRVERRPDGGFDVSGMLFHMPGLWELHFDITRAGITERAETDIDLE